MPFSRPRGAIAAPCSTLSARQGGCRMKPNATDPRSTPLIDGDGRVRIAGRAGEDLRDTLSGAAMSMLPPSSPWPSQCCDRSYRGEQLATVPGVDLDLDSLSIDGDQIVSIRLVAEPRRGCRRSL